MLNNFENKNPTITASAPKAQIVIISAGGIHNGEKTHHHDQWIILAIFNTANIKVSNKYESSLNIINV